MANRFAGTADRVLATAEKTGLSTQRAPSSIKKKALKKESNTMDKKRAILTLFAPRPSPPQSIFCPSFNHARSDSSSPPSCSCRATAADRVTALRTN